MNWILCEEPGTSLWWARPMEKCKRTRKQKYTFSILISSWQCNYSKKRVLYHRLENSAKTTGILMSGSAVKNHGWPKRGRQWNAKRTISYRLLFHGRPPILVAIRLQHRHCKICLQQVQPKSEVTDLLQETGADSPKTKTKMKRGMAVEIRMTVCEIFLNGWRSSQMISRTQMCLHSRTFLGTQIRNVRRKWYLIPGSIVCVLASQKTEIVKSACEPKRQGLLAEDALAKLYLEQKLLMTW